MYVDSKPVSTYAETHGWRMPAPTPSPQPPSSLKRPPLLTNGSSSSLSGMEQAIPSFQSFIGRTPPPDSSKPLPPTPLIPRRASSASPPRSRTPSPYSQRRSSSVYSRTVSQWFDDDSSWRSVDLRDHPLPAMPPLPILQPVAYSKSTPQLTKSAATPSPAVLEPRTYSPLINTPSPTASRVTTPSHSPAPSPGPSPFPPLQPQPVIYPTSLPLRQGPQKQVQTVSLEQAKAAVHSPGAVHLLPEELRAQSHVRSRSHEPVRRSTLAFFDNRPPPPPELPVPPPPTFVDAEGRHRSLHQHTKSLDDRVEYPFPVMYGYSPPRLSIAQHGKTPLETQPRDAPRVKAAESLGLQGDEAPRGRTRQRGPRSMDYGHYIPQPRRPASGSSGDQEEKDAQEVAAEYHTLLSEQYRQPSMSPAYNSDDSIRAHMKMVPQPLFKNKPAAKLPGSVSAQLSDNGRSVSESPFHLRADSVASKPPSGTQGSFPPRLGSTPGSDYRLSSRTGSIPISPPMQMSALPRDYGRFAGSTASPKRQKKSRSRSQDERVSMYYPYVGSRKGKKAKEKKSAERPAPPLPLLPADVIAQRLRTPSGSTETSPLHSSPSVDPNRTASKRKESNASSDRQRTPLLQRLAGNAVKYADLLSQPSGIPESHTHKSGPSDTTIASEHSPHLLPSPVKSDPPPVHLGWSDSSKTKFDRSRSSMQSAAAEAAEQRTSQPTNLTHLPARPLDERYVGASEAADGRGRKGSVSILGGLLEGWKERKKEEKREELKKIIRVVPQLPPPRMQTREIVRPPGEGLVRQSSMGAGALPVGARPSSGGLARRMSAFGWM